MSPLRMRMIEDMTLAGLSPGTQATYTYYRRSPDQLSEKEVRAYILNLRERGAARGTFKGTCWFAPKNLLEGAKRLLWGSNRIGDRGRIVPAPGSKLAYWVIGLSASTASHPLQLLATCSGIALTDHEAISGDAPL